MEAVCTDVNNAILLVWENNYEETLYFLKQTQTQNLRSVT